MARRSVSFTLPDAPPNWEPSSREMWNRLIQVLENSELFDKARRNRVQFQVKGTVSAPLTLDVNNPEVTVVAHILAKLLNALEDSKFVDIR